MCMTRFATRTSVLFAWFVDFQKGPLDALRANEPGNQKLLIISN